MAHNLVQIDKIDQTSVTYEGPELNKKEFTCAGCIMFFSETGQCAILNPDNVKANGGCNLWVGGDAMKRPDEAHFPMRLVPAHVAGYVDNGPFTCKRCANFEGYHGPGTCRRVEGIVHADGCCNAWKKSEYDSRMLDVPFDKLGL